MIESQQGQGFSLPLHPDCTEGMPRLLPIGTWGTRVWSWPLYSTWCQVQYCRFSGHHCNQVISSIVSHVLCDPAVSCLALHMIRSVTCVIQFSSALSRYCKYIQKPSNYGSPPCCSFNVNPETGTFCHPLWIWHAYFCYTVLLGMDRCVKMGCDQCHFH